MEHLKKRGGDFPCQSVGTSNYFAPSRPLDDINLLLTTFELTNEWSQKCREVAGKIFQKSNQVGFSQKKDGRVR